MEKIKEYKKEIGIILILLILLVLAFIYYSNSRNDLSINNEVVESTKIEKLVLFGSKEIVLEEGDTYIEPGYYAITNTKEVKKNEVLVTPSNIDINSPGIYYINYEIEGIKEQRKIIVKEKEETNISKQEEGKTTFNLKGESMLVLNLGDAYIEAGYEAYDTRFGDITSSVKVNGIVNTNKAGTYTITYELDLENGNKYTKTRTIIVKESLLEALVSGNPTVVTNNNITLTITVTGDNFYYIKYPNGGVSKNKISSYVIEKNGTYKFLIYDKNLNYIIKEVKVDKIDKTSSKNPTVVPPAQTIDTNSPIGSCVATLKDFKTTVKVTSNSSIKSYNYNGIITTSNVYSTDKYLRDAYVILTGTNNKTTKINCSINYETMPVRKPSGSISYKAESDTLKVYITKNDGFYLSYIWAKDPVNQLKKQLTSGSSKVPEKLLSTAVENNNLNNKIVLGFNASAIVNDIYWNDLAKKYPEYNLKEPSALLIYNGKVIINDYDRYPVNRQIYYIDTNNQLKYIPLLKNKTSSERKKIFQEVIDSGVQNTFSFRSILVENSKVVKLESDSLYSELARRQAICQLDSNNFILLTSINGLKSGSVTTNTVANYLLKLGCKTVANLDGGGSTATFFKPRGTKKLTSVTGGGRALTSVMYFTELN